MQFIKKKFGKVKNLESPYLIGEDFAWFAREIPSSLVMLGCSSAEKLGDNNLHEKTFVADEKVMEIGVKVGTDFVMNCSTSL